MTRLSVKKTYKLYIGGAFPRSESGRTFEASGHNVARASRKDARDAVRAARAALPAWSGMTAYNRGQVLYRLAEMMEARATDLERACSGGDEVDAAIDLVVWYAGWADKLAQVIGSSNPVAGPYFNFTIPEPTGVVAILAPAEPPLAGLVSRVLPALVGGNTYQRLGAVKPYSRSPDPGRFKLTKNEADRKVFKVPSLRNVAETAPYYHDGGVASLEEAVRQMAEFQLGRNLTAEQTRQIVDFLKVLTGKIDAEYIKAPVLPKSTPKTPKPDLS
jgi:hypothetical protein